MLVLSLALLAARRVLRAAPSLGMERRGARRQR
jgi:hypothetical protein